MHYLGTFRPEFEKHCHIWNMHLQISQCKKFHAKQYLKRGTKTTFLGISRLQLELIVIF